MQEYITTITPGQDTTFSSADRGDTKSDTSTGPLDFTGLASKTRFSVSDKEAQSVTGTFTSLPSLSARSQAWVEKRFTPTEKNTNHQASFDVICSYDVLAAIGPLAPLTGPLSFGTSSVEAYAYVKRWTEKTNPATGETYIKYETLDEQEITSVDADGGNRNDPDSGTEVTKTVEVKKGELTAYDPYVVGVRVETSASASGTGVAVGDAHKGTSESVLTSVPHTSGFVKYSDINLRWLE